MASNGGMTVRKFNALKTDVARCYDDNKCLSMLKVLFRDKVADQTLAEITCVMDLLNDLSARGHFGPDDLTLLHDTISITKHFALGKELKNKFPSFPDVKEGNISTKFELHRQKLMKLGMTLILADVTKIDGLYNEPLKRYPDSWSMIIDLEDNLEIVKGKMDDFIESLTTLNLRRALKALTEDIGDTSIATLRPSSTTDAPDTDRANKDILQEEPYIMPKLSQEDFNQLLVDVSSWWKKLGNISILKVILSEFKDIPVAQIEQKNQPNALFRLLLGPGHISPADITVLVEAAVLGGQRGVEEKIKKTIPTFPGLSKIVICRFSKHRQNLMKFGNVIDTDNIEAIGDLFDLDKQTDQWGLIFQLEKNLKLTDDPTIKESFIKKLKDNDMIGEAKALNTF
ncbi:uncharacterized protein LOC117112677 [Anneissia japonica]|uniref:uncharacterized protein LOC117112677 n=1 Tax=Anneissia japonica TaxID=1529436 RepID=UPI001425A820|nr:uncharacterized protein LOC117112677 [Anneissia japonica]XP_033111700.1 uncharacterized protein LOC117112677 [Anneissia japonica]XP_033111701.1 uncharacterized protein LOC117112677 [Anneissia japonica]XP_033111702.1 uncharacterized protein LOC117112677 [Anneissia japonica]XP_033111703.1 uncharacterized protein LOC117112677 [Anneissia japonica]XP_033111704.1 uncharacterized protein LOC117112677 [Anneissia japonica]